MGAFHEKSLAYGTVDIWAVASHTGQCQIKRADSLKTMMNTTP